MSAPRATTPGPGPGPGPGSGEPVPVHSRALDLDLGSSTQTSHRLLAYSDALLSIIATVMILPVAHTKIHPDQKLGESVQQLLLTKIAVYLMTFLIVTVAWAAHVRDTSHWTRLLKAPSSLALNTSKDGTLQRIVAALF